MVAHGFPANVLVVDDDPAVGSLIAELLGDAGFGVVKASGFFDALQFLESRHFDLVITDVALPGALTGVDLVFYARSQHPGLKSLFISGKSVPVVGDPDQDDFVTKPFHPRELLGCVFELLYRQSFGNRTGCPRANRAAIEAKIARLRQRH